MKFTQIPSRQLADKVADEARRDQVRAIEELQGHASRYPAGGRVLLARVTFAASSQFTPRTATRAVLLRMVGGGGGGAGTTGGVGTLDAGSGGSSGVYLEKWIESTAAMTGGAIAIGAAGAAGASGGGQGGTGGDTTVTVNGKTFTAKGGLGGVAIGAGSTNAFQAHTAIQTGSSSDDFTAAQGGSGGMRLGAGSALGGIGGSSPFGGGGVTAAVGNGTGGNGYGSGGGGAVSTTSNQTGGAGAGGLVIIEEFS